MALNKQEPRTAIDAPSGAELQGRLMETVQRLPEWEAERRRRVRALVREVSAATVESTIRDLKARYGDLEQVSGYLDAVASDVIENVDNFLSQEGGDGPAAMPPGQLLAIEQARAGVMRRYRVNVMIGDGKGSRAPVVSEDLPTQTSPLGQISTLM